MTTEDRAEIRLNVGSVTRRTDGPPRVNIDFSRERYPDNPEVVFQPLRLPNRAEITLGGPLPRCIHRANIRFRLRLQGGEFEVPLASGPPCVVRIAENAVATGRVRIGTTLGRGRPVVQSIDLDFTPALVLDNVLQTLQQVHEIIEDRRLSPLRKLLSKTVAPRIAPWLQRFGPLSELAAEAGVLALGSADTAAEIFLERATARPRWSASPTLPFRFSGRIRWMEQLETRFTDFALPAAVLPVPFADLDHLLSAEPLATAALVDDPADPDALLQAVLDTFDTAEVDFEVEMVAPAVQTNSTTLDGAGLSAAVRAPQPLQLRGDLSVKNNGDGRLTARADALHIAQADSDATTRLDLSAELDLGLDRPDKPWADRLDVSARAAVRPDSVLPELLLDLTLDEHLTGDQHRVGLGLHDAIVRGALALRWSDGQLALHPHGDALFSGGLRSRGPIRLRDANGEVGVELDTTLSARISQLSANTWHVYTESSAVLGSQVDTRLATLPELNIVDGKLQGNVVGRAELSLENHIWLTPDGGFSVQLGRNTWQLVLDALEFSLEGRRVTLPAGTRLSGRTVEGEIASRGFEGLAAEISWDLSHGRCLLHHDGQAISLITPALRSGQITLHLDPSGRIRFSGDPSGLYGARYFNVLVNPLDDPEHLAALLRSDDAIHRVLAALAAFAPEPAEAVQDIRALALAAREIFRREKIEEPRHIVPRKAMARIFSLLLAGDASLEQRFAPLIRRVTEGGGLDLVEAKALAQQQLGDFNIDFEVGAVLHWLNLVLSPTEPLPPPPTRELPSLAEDPRFADARRGLPSADDIYCALQTPPLSPAWAVRLEELAPLLTLEQIDHILSRVHQSWPDELTRRLIHVRGAKARVKAIGQGYGGAEYILQPAVVGTFLGEVVGPLPGINRPEDAPPGHWPPRCALGPREVAVLLQAGQSTGREGKRAQINNRLLLELLRRRPTEFCWSVMVEISHQNPRALSGILYALLDQDQDSISEPIDIAALLEKKLDLEVPRKEDYMAGGRRARESYFGALSELSDRIVEGSLPYLARKVHLQVARAPEAPALVIPPSAETLAHKARHGIARADELGQKCTFASDKRGGPRAKARQAYHRAFRHCARLLDKEPRAFQLPWFKAFWLRNEEALSLLSAVRGYQEDREKDRRWLHVTSGREPTGEQDLLQLLVQTTIWDEPSRQALLSDPLNRLLIDPEPGNYRFSIIGAHGVITEGAEGTELEHAYGRLERRRGVKVIRAATATARSLEYNAQRIIEAIEACDTPWGILGYSQGCANALTAEAMLLGGPPDRRRLLHGLVCRNLLFSAANGSAHGTAGALKFQRAVELGEKYLKHYQAVLSKQAIETALRAVRMVLDAHLFVAVLGGVHSLTFERADDLFRDGQCLPHVPTSTRRAVVTDDRLPETLEFMYYMLRQQCGPSAQDTQVMLPDAVGSSTRIQNAYTEILAACDMGSYPLASHHWAPLTREVEFVSTPRDRELAIYDGPKDRLVWSWVEVNARFGRIQRV